LFYCRVHLVENSSPSKHKKRKRHTSNNDYEPANWNASAEVAEPATDDVELATSLVTSDHVQHSHVKLKKKKKHKSQRHKSQHHDKSHDVEDKLISDVNSGQIDGKMARHFKVATNDCWLSLSHRHETLPAVQNGKDNDTADQDAPTSGPLEVQVNDTVLNNPEHLMQPRGLQPETALVTSKAVMDVSMSESLSPAKSQVNDINLVSDEQQVKLSCSAKRRRRRHRGKKNDHRKDEGDVLNGEQGKNILAAVGSSLQNVSGNNSPTQTNHSSGFECTHIIFDNVNSDDETGIKAHTTTTQPACDEYDSRTFKDRATVCNTVVADGIVNRRSDIETALHLQHENTVSSGLVSSYVKKASFTTHLPSETKACRTAKNTPFANVQVYCRQRIKKSASATTVTHDQATDTVTSPLPEKASLFVIF